MERSNYYYFPILFLFLLMAMFSHVSYAQANLSFQYKNFFNVSLDISANDFPLLLAGNATTFNYSNFEENGTEIRIYNFTENFGQSSKPLYIPHWNTSGTSFIWTEFPSLQPGYIYHKNLTPIPAISSITSMHFLEWETGEITINNSVNPANNQCVTCIAGNGWISFGNGEKYNYSNEVVFSGNRSIKFTDVSNSRIANSTNYTAPATLEAWIYDNSVDLNGVAILNIHNPGDGGNNNGYIGIFAEGGGALQTNYSYYCGGFFPTQFKRSTGWHRFIIKASGGLGTDKINYYYSNLTHPYEMFIANCTQAVITIKPTIDARNINGVYFDDIILRSYTFNDPDITMFTEESIDADPPTVSYVSPTPQNGATTSNTTLNVNVTVVDSFSNIDTCILEFNGTNATMTKFGTGLSVACSISQAVIDGNISFKVFANDTNGNIGNTITNTIIVDTTVPLIQIKDPSPSNGNTSIDGNLTFNATATNGNGIDVCTLEINGINYTMTKIGTGIVVDCTRNLVLSQGVHYWKIFANDTLSNIGNSTQRYVLVTGTPASTGNYTLVCFEDTFVTQTKTVSGQSGIACPSYPGANMNYNASFNYEGLNFTQLYFVQSTPSALDMRGYYKFYPAGIQNRVIQAVNFTWLASFSGCGSPTNRSIYFMTQNYNTSTITYNNMPSLASSVIIKNDGFMPIFPTNNKALYDIVNLGTENDTGVSRLMASLYGSDTTAFQTDGFMRNINGTLSTLICGGVGTRHCVYSVESATSNQPKLYFTLVDFLTKEIHRNATVATSNMFFDFETGGNNINTADFLFRHDNNTLNSFVGNVTTFSADFKDPQTDNPNLNTLENIDCSLATYNLGSSNIPVEANNIYCFNLTSLHNGNEFWGGIKVKLYSTTNFFGLYNGGKFDFFYSLQSPSLFSFSNIQLTPDPPQVGSSLFVFYSTSLPLTSNIRYRTVINSTNITNWINIINETGFTRNHVITVPASGIKSGTFQFQLFGSDQNATEYESEIFNRTVGARNIFTIPNATVPGIIEDLSETGFCGSFSDCSYLFGFILLAICGLFAVYFGGMEFALGIIVTGIIVFSIIGLLPVFLMIPLLVIAVIIIVSLVLKVVQGG